MTELLSNPSLLVICCALTTLSKKKVPEKLANLSIPKTQQLNFSLYHSVHLREPNYFLFLTSNRNSAKSRHSFCFRACSKITRFVDNMTGFVSRYAQMVAAAGNYNIRIHRLFALIIVNTYNGCPQFEIFCQRSEVTCVCAESHLIAEWEFVWKMFFRRAMSAASERQYYVSHRYM